MRAPGLQLLTLNYEKLLSSFAFNFILRPAITVLAQMKSILLIGRDPPL